MSNYRQNPQIKISFYDIPLYIHAFAIGRNTALMCNEQLVKEEMIKQHDFLKNQNHPLFDIFDEHVLAKLGLEINNHPEAKISVYFKAPRWQPEWYSKGYIVVDVNEKTFSSDQCDWPKDTPKIEEIKKIIEQDNQETILEFDYFSSPAICETLSIANATAIMCDARKISPNLKAVIEDIKNQTPKWFEYFKEEDICKLGTLIQNHSSEDFKVEIIDADNKSWNPNYKIHIFCSEEKIISTYYKKYNEDFNDHTYGNRNKRFH